MKSLKRFIPLILVIAATALVFSTGWTRYLTLDALKEHSDLLQAQTQTHYIPMLLGLMVIFAILTATMIPGVVIVTLTAGYLFGPWVGALATALAATIGALALYYVGRTGFAQRLRQIANTREGVLLKICKGVDDNTFWYVAVSRLIVSVPFHLINLAAGVMSAPLKSYLAGTFIGLIPAHMLYCWIGSGLQDILEQDELPSIGSLLETFFWPVMGVGFLSIALPVGIKLVKHLVGDRV